MGCPGPEDDVYFKIDSFSAQANCLDESLQNCEDVFKISLNVITSTVFVASNNFKSSFSYGVCYAKYEPFYYLQNEVVKCSVINLNEFDSLPGGNLINDYFEIDLNDINWLDQLSNMVQAINRSLIEIEKNGNDPFFLYKIKDLDTDYTGDIRIELELSDGNVLTSTVEDVFIAAN